MSFIDEDGIAEGFPPEILDPLVERAESDGTTLELTMVSKGKPLDYHAGQFAIIKIQEPGLREPHAHRREGVHVR